jgi:hypothetical protein
VITAAGENLLTTISSLWPVVTRYYFGDHCLSSPLNAQ